MRLANVVAPIGLLIAAGCSHAPSHDAKPLAARARQDGESIDVSSMSATVRGADSSRPRCPVHPHAEASLLIQGVRGPVEYRWERSDSTAGPVVRLVIDSAAAGKLQHLPIQPDDWTDTKSGTQLRIDETVHVTYPFDFRSAPITLDAMCY